MTSPCPETGRLKGFGTPIYTNFLYPFVKDPPRVTTEPPADHTQHPLRNPGRELSAFVRAPQGMVRQPSLPSPGRGEVSVLRVGKRPAYRLQPGQHGSGRVRGYRRRPTRRQPPRAGGLPMERRELPGRSRHVAPGGRLPRRDSDRQARYVPATTSPFVRLSTKLLGKPKFAWKSKSARTSASRVSDPGVGP